MVTRALLAACIVFAMTATSFPAATATSECDAAQRALSGAVERSPAELSEELAQSIASAMGACDDARINLNPMGPKTRFHLSANDLVCGAGSAAGTGTMYVTLWTAATGSVPYQTTGLMSYERFSNHDEFITARDATATGFDVWQRSGWITGTVYVAGVPFPADEADVDGDCAVNGDPCHALGYVAYLYRDVQVWIIGNLEICI